MMCSGVIVSPIRLASISSPNLFWTASGRSPYPGENRVVRNFPSFAARRLSSASKLSIDRRLHALLSDGWMPARRALGPHGDADPLLSEDGSWEPPSRVRAGWYGLRADFARASPGAAGVASLRFHDLRHIHASLLLAEGADLKEVSTRLGHADTGVTTEIYGHVMPGHDQRVADAWGRLMGDPGE